MHLLVLHELYTDVLHTLRQKVCVPVRFQENLRLFCIKTVKNAYRKKILCIICRTLLVMENRQGIVASSFAASETTGYIFFLFNLRMLKDTTCSKNHYIHNGLQQSIPKVVSSLLPRQICSAMRNVFL